MFGLWQAGRRPHAGPVLLLSLAVAVSTLALGLASTAERSLQDQADFQVGADLRLVETDNSAPDTPGRGPGRAARHPRRAARRARCRADRAEGTPVSVLALDAASAARGRAVPRRSGRRLARTGSSARWPTAASTPPSSRSGRRCGRITGRIETTTRFDALYFAPPVRTSAVLLDRRGNQRLVPLGHEHRRDAAARSPSTSTSRCDRAAWSASSPSCRGRRST